MAFMMQDVDLLQPCSAWCEQSAKTVMISDWPVPHEDQAWPGGMWHITLTVWAGAQPAY